MYFNYDTDYLRGRLYSFGVIAQDLRIFLENNVFYRAQDGEVDIICHSTGCAIARQYVANNPFDHRVRRILMVAGANHGAYYAETTSRVKQFISSIPFFEFLLQTHGDKQIQELKYGSFSLFYLQQRWHHLFVKELLVEDGKPPEEDWLKDKPFEEFVYVVSKDEDKKYDGRKVKLPEVMAVVGTNSWHTGGPGKFSDGVIRVESALPDCRFLASAPKGITTPNLGGNCSNRLIAFLPCFHTRLFSESGCRDSVLEAVKGFLAPPAEERTEGHKALKDFFEKHVKDADVKGYVSELDTAALWIRVLHTGLARRPEEYRTTEDWEKALEEANRKIEVRLPEAQRRTAPWWKLGIYENDFTEAIRISEVSPEKIFYYKYLKAETKGTEVEFQILVGGDPVTIETPTRKEKTTTGGPYRLIPGQTVMVNCQNKRDGGFMCEELTSNVDVPPEHIPKSK